jgi:hypothetical protein
VALEVHLNLHVVDACDAFADDAPAAQPLEPWDGQ